MAIQKRNQQVLCKEVGENFVTETIEEKEKSSEIMLRYEKDSDVVMQITTYFPTVLPALSRIPSSITNFRIVEFLTVACTVYIVFRQESILQILLNYA